MEANQMEVNQMEANQMEANQMEVNSMEVNSMEVNSMEANLIVVGTSPARLTSPFYICTLLRMLNFNPRTDRCSVSTEQHTVKIFHNVEKKSMA